jgi:MFS family permease
MADVVIAFACPVDAFNLTAVLFGTAAAPLVTSFFSQRYGDNLRTAFLIVLPVAYVGSALLIAARKHLEADTSACSRWWWRRRPASRSSPNRRRNEPLPASLVRLRNCGGQPAGLTRPVLDRVRRRLPR